MICGPLIMHGSEESDFGRDLIGCSTDASFAFQCSILSVSPLPLLHIFPGKFWNDVLLMFPGMAQPQLISLLEKLTRGL